MRNYPRKTRKQTSSADAARPPLLSAAEQTRQTWARTIPSYAAVPEVFKSFFESYQASGQEFPYMVLTPSNEAFIFKTTEKLICDLGSEIAVLERSGNNFVAKCYPVDQISYIEIRSVLLDSRLKLTGITGQGTPISSTLRFNSVTDYLFTPILEKIRLAGKSFTPDSYSFEPEKFETWIHRSYKFMNYARRSLLEGEKVLQAVLQTEIRKKRFTFLGRTFYKTVSPTLVTILTDRELILIREEIRQIGGGRYGGVWDYIPLDKILDLSLAERGDGLLALSVQLVENARLECLFQAAARQELVQLLVRFRELTLA